MSERKSVKKGILQSFTFIANISEIENRIENVVNIECLFHKNKSVYNMSQYVRMADNISLLASWRKNTYAF